MPDSNFEQTISFAEASLQLLKVEFVKSSDLFGRIILYNFEVLGKL
jgi:hypothetical protein